MSRATVAAGRRGHHVLLEICGVGGNRVMCCPKADAQIELGKVAYFAEADRKDGEPVQIRDLKSVYLVEGDRLVFRDHLSTLQLDGEGKPTITGGLWVVQLCGRCRSSLAGRVRVTA